MNLAINASHAMPDGGTLSLTLKNANYDQYEVSPGQAISGSYVVLSIEDTGVGMNDETRARIFDPFFTTKTKGKGTGLGLATTYSIIEQHHGDITVESTEGKGTTFTIFLPAIGTRAEDVLEEKDQDLARSGNARILLVDDEEDILVLGEKTLGELGYKVKCFNNSLEALDTFCAQPDNFDLVITDQTMPHMSGDKLAKELLKIRKDIPVILCTGYSEKINKEKALAIGIKEVLMKPFGVEDLGSAVSYVLEKS
jgi:CheY-like chemotaxis protein